MFYKARIQQKLATVDAFGPDNNIVDFKHKTNAKIAANGFNLWTEWGAFGIKDTGYFPNNGNVQIKDWIFWVK